MSLILAIIVGISVGLSYLITDYFFRTKELELNDKGGQVAMMIRYFDAMHMDKTILREYLTSMDQLVGARIWVFNNQFDLIGASETGTEYEQVHDGSDSSKQGTGSQAPGKMDEKRGGHRSADPGRRPQQRTVPENPGESVQRGPGQ